MFSSVHANCHAGNANLPIGVYNSANQEIGVPSEGGHAWHAARTLRTAHRPTHLRFPENLIALQSAPLRIREQVG